MTTDYRAGAILQKPILVFVASNKISLCKGIVFLCKFETI